MKSNVVRVSTRLNQLAKEYVTEDGEYQRLFAEVDRMKKLSNEAYEARQAIAMQMKPYLGKYHDKKVVRAGGHVLIIEGTSSPASKFPPQVTVTELE